MFLLVRSGIFSYGLSQRKRKYLAGVLTFVVNGETAAGMSTQPFVTARLVLDCKIDPLVQEMTILVTAVTPMVKMLGGGRTTATVKEQVLVLPQISVAETLTVFVVSALKYVPEGGMETTVIPFVKPAQSTALALHTT